MSADYKITIEPRALTSHVLPLIYEGVSEMWQDQVAPATYLDFPVQPIDRVVYAEASDGDPVAVICFRLAGPEGVVSLLYVEPSSRRLGLAAQLWGAMLKELANMGALTVRVAVDSQNDGGLAAALAVGAVDTVRVFEQDVPKVL